MKSHLHGKSCSTALEARRHLSLDVIISDADRFLAPLMLSEYLQGRMEAP